MRRCVQLIVLFASPACAQDSGQSLFGGGDPLAVLTYQGPGAGGIQGSAQRVTVQGPGFTGATDATLTTDAAGRVQLRGFLGQYSLTVTHKDGGHSSRFDLAREGVELPVRLRPSEASARLPF